MDCMRNVEILDEPSEGSPRLEEATAIFSELQREYEADPCDIAKCKQLLSQLKLLVAFFPSCSPKPEKLNKAELLLGREEIEYGALVSVRNKDVEAFERYVVRLNTFYEDFNKYLPTSQRRHAIIGMYLLHLVSSNRIGDFHMALELVPVEDRSNYCITHSAEMERHLMDGNYHKVLAAERDMPLPMYSFFMDLLMNTVREKIAQCLEKSYVSMDLSHAKKLLLLESIEEVKNFAFQENQRKETEGIVGVRWEVFGNELKFSAAPKQADEVLALELIYNMIGYATELERIV